MRALLLAGLLASFPIAAAAAEPPECVGEGSSRLFVDVVGARSASGEVAVTLYPDDPSRFLAPGGKQARVRLPAISPVTQACFRVERGAYAIAVYHDANANRDFDRTIVGMPLEGFGFSRNPENLTALPDYDSVRTVVRSGDQKLTIRLRYP